MYTYMHQDCPRSTYMEKRNAYRILMGKLEGKRSLRIAGVRG
jgi:hypothetical protein